MCFSATASLVTAGLTGAAGLVSLGKVNALREVPLAAVPVFFAAQRGIEGSLWIALGSDPQGCVAASLTLGFLLFAEVPWPIYAPVAVWLVEPNATRRKAMLICIGLGVGVSLYLLWWIVTHSHAAGLADGHIDYVTEARHSGALGVAYLVATCLAMLLSSRRTLVLLGVIVLIGSVAALFFYWEAFTEAFTSVWCFFAAAASVVIIGHFEYERRPRVRQASA